MLDPADESQSATPPANRLVIRVKITSDEPPEAAPLPPRFNRNALLIAGVVAVLLGWAGISMLRTASTPEVSDEPLSRPATETAETRPAQVEPRSAEAKPVDPEVREQPDAPPSPINEVLPDVPRSALETIRGTVRVSVRVTIDKAGTVIAATADDRGPSRYFERLALEASKQWTFTPAHSAEQRVMLVKFAFTRAGATAQANSLP